MWKHLVPVGLLFGFAACASMPSAPPGWRERLAGAPPAPPANAFPLPPERLEILMRNADLEILALEPTDTGVSGAMKMEARIPGVERPLSFKWKEAPDGGGWNNTPRREIAAYQIQKWFLDPVDYVVPTTRAVCMLLEAFPAGFDPEPGFGDGACAFGTLSIWLEGVTVPDRLFEAERFYEDARYARHLAHYNLLTFLIENRDTRPGNHLVSEDPENRRVYSVDNGISFGEWFYNYFTRHWDVIRVPAVPRVAIERLRRVTRDDLEQLAVVAELRRDSHGVLREVRPSPAFDPERGVRRRDDVVQLGLRPGEIEGVTDRLRELLSAVDEGEIPVF